MRNQIDLDKLLGLESKATASPWFCDDWAFCVWSENAKVADCFELMRDKGTTEDVEANLLLIAETRNSIRELCLELKAAREIVEAARDALDDMDRMFRTTQRLEDALKELEGEK